MPSVSLEPSVSNAPSFTNGTLNQKIVVVSVIDEAIGYPHITTAETLKLAWDDFRATYPDRPFCLLQPRGRIKRDLQAPEAFWDEVDAGTSIFSKVDRDNGDVSERDNWFQICNLEGLRQSGVTAVALFVDNSGSLSGTQIQASIDFFMERVEANNMELLDAIYNGDENWIQPHIVDYA